MKKFIFLSILSFLFVTDLWALTSTETGIQPNASLYKNQDLTTLEGLQVAHQKEGILKEWSSLQIAKIYLDHSEWNQALESLSSIPAASVWDFKKNVYEAKAYLGLHQPAQAFNSLKDLPSDPVIDQNQTQTAYRTLYKQALELKLQAASQMGRNVTFLQRRIWALFPDFEEPIQKNPSYSVSPEDIMDRIHIFHELRMFEEIPGLIQPSTLSTAKAPQEKKCISLFELGYSLNKAKQYENALDSFKRVKLLRCQGEALSRSLYWQGLVEQRLKQYDAAIQTYVYYLKHFPHHQYTDDAYYFLAKIYRTLKQTNKADQARKKLLALPQGDMQEKVLWYQAFDDYKKKRYSAASKSLKLILKTKSLANEAHQQAQYWLARILENQTATKKGLSSKAKQAYEKLIQDYPFSFYAILASHRLGIAHKIPSIPAFKLPPINHRAVAELTGIVDVLNKLGYQDKSLEVMDYLQQNYSKQITDYPQWMALKWMESGDYHQTLRYAEEHFDSNLFNVDITGEDPMIQALYPLAYYQVTQNLSQNPSLSHSMIMGIMREESLFLPTIRSHAGAQGVMQLMPGTAKLVANELAMNDFDLEKLADPQTNMLLGSTYFASMVQKFDSVPLAIMAYNAGPGNVRKWLKQKGNLPLDEFIESIPFSETRGYIKRVLRSMQIYGALTKDPQLQKPFFSFKLPEKYTQTKKKKRK